MLIARWHSGIVLPKDVLPLSHVLRGSNANLLSIGWGNQRFYMAAHPDSGDAIAALFRSPSALLVQPMSSPRDSSSADVRIRWICADRNELWRVARYIDESLLLARGKPIILGEGPFPGSRFYASTGHYSIVHTCNTWTLAALQYAGLPVSARGALFASQVARRVDALRACPAP